MKKESMITRIVDHVQGASGLPAPPERPDPEVPTTRPRRRFSAAYKLRILREIDTCAGTGEIGALLRREGLYHSNIQTWRRQLEEGVLAGLSPRKRGRKLKPINPMAKKVAELERQNKKLQKQLKQAETIIEVQKKISELLGIPLDDQESR